MGVARVSMVAKATPIPLRNKHKAKTTYSNHNIHIAHYTALGTRSFNGAETPECLNNQPRCRSKDRAYTYTSRG